MTPPDSAPSVHTPEPWETGEPGIGYTHRIDENSQGIECAELPMPDYDRSIACVNAMSGVSDPAAMLEKVREALEESQSVLLYNFDREDIPKTAALLDEALALLPPIRISVDAHHAQAERKAFLP